MKRAIINLRQVTKNMEKPNTIFFNKIAPNNQVKIPDDKNRHPPLSRPAEYKKKQKKDEKYEMFLL